MMDNGSRPDDNIFPDAVYAGSVNDIPIWVDNRIEDDIRYYVCASGEKDMAVFCNESEMKYIVLNKDI